MRVDTVQEGLAMQADATTVRGEGGNRKFGVKDVLTSDAQCLVFLAEHDGQVLTSRRIGVGSVGRQQLASRATGRLIQAGLADRDIVGGGAKQRFRLTPKGRDVLAEFHVALQAARNGVEPKPGDALPEAATRLMTGPAQAFLLVLANPGAALSTAHMCKAVGKGASASRRAFDVLHGMGWVQRVASVANQPAQYAPTADAVAAVDEVLAAVGHARQEASTRPVAPLGEPAMRVLLETSAPVLKRGDWSGKASFHCPGAEQHLRALYAAGLVAVVPSEDGVVRWVPTSEGWALAQAHLGARRP